MYSLDFLASKLDGEVKGDKNVEIKKNSYTITSW